MFAGVQTLGRSIATMGALLHKGFPMLHYAIVFFVIALIAAVLGFGGIAASAAGIAQLLFVVFIILALVTFALGLLRRG